MEYRRWVALGLRFTLAVIAALWLLGLIAVWLNLGPSLLRDRDFRINIALGSCLLQLAIAMILGRLDPSPPGARYKQPTAAVSGAAVVVLTGLAAAVATGGNARTASDFAVPVTILAVTAGLATRVYRFAKRNEGEIGEARFDTTER